MASRSVSDIGGRTFWNQANSGPLSTRRRRSGRARGSATASQSSQKTSSSQPGAWLNTPIRIR